RPWAKYSDSETASAKTTARLAQNVTNDACAREVLLAGWAGEAGEVKLDLSMDGLEKSTAQLIRGVSAALELP
ncbi:hypothetical protein AO269_24580, partial [Pseudomonas putida]